MQASGIVGAVKPRNIAGGKVAYSFVIDGGDWYGTYTNEPPPVGSYVEFEYKVNGAGFNNVNYNTLKVTEAEEAAKPEAAPAAKKAYAGASNKDANIQWQSARNCAATFILGAVEAGIVKVESLEALQILVNAQTLDYFAHSLEVAASGDVPEDLRG